MHCAGHLPQMSAAGSAVKKDEACREGPKAGRASDKRRWRLRDWTLGEDVMLEGLGDTLEKKSATGDRMAVET